MTVDSRLWRGGRIELRGAKVDGVWQIQSGFDENCGTEEKFIGRVWKCDGFIAVRCQNRSLNGLEATLWWVSFASGRAGRHIFASTRLRLLGSEAARENIGGKVAAGRVGGDAVRHPLGRQGREVAEVGMCRHGMAPVPADIVATGKWVGVKKKRAQRLYQVSGPWFPDVCACGSPNSQGCTVNDSVEH